MAVDLFLPEDIIGDSGLNVTIFCHGFKGFKDWGFIPHLHEFLVDENNALITFNHSLNGVKETDFDDLESFSVNTVGNELRDLESLALWINETGSKEYPINPKKITWIGHSRGGGNVILFGSLFPDFVHKIITWSAIDSYEHLFNYVDKDKWEKDGIYFIENKRTKQQMPLSFELWKEYEEHKERYQIISSARSITQPLLILHGSQDESVDINSSKRIYESCLHSIFIPISEAGHTFGCAHPMNSLAAAPEPFWKVLENTYEFITEDMENDIEPEKDNTPIQI